MSLLTLRSVEKPWGRDILPAPFSAPEGRRIGEIWFEPPAELPSILVKYIFTSEKLSVQVHPDDAQAERAGETDRGKEECWLVIDAEPDAVLGIGFEQPIDATTLREVALDGQIEQLITWHRVRPGDFFFIPANTVHAIGAGISLIEIQQNSDITYRLYDYGRPRELHLDAGIAVSRAEPYSESLHKLVPDNGTIELARSRYFTAHRIEGAPDAALLAEYAGPLLVIPRTGTITLGTETLPAGSCALAPDLGAVQFDVGAQAIIVRPE